MGKKRLKIGILFFWLGLCALTAFIEGAVSVPNLIGYKQEDALALLKKSGLQGKIILVQQAPLPTPPPVGRVFDQTPAAGAKVEAGTMVTIRIYRPLTILAPVPPQQIYKKKSPTIILPPKLTEITKTETDLQIWGSSSPNLGEKGYPTDIYIYRRGEEPIVLPVEWEWTLLGQEKQVLGKERKSIVAQDLYAKPSEPTGQYEIAKCVLEWPEFFKKKACSVELRVDPENRLAETNEDNNSCLVTFGECQPLPQPANPQELIDLVPEFDSSLLTAPDAYGDRHVQFRVVNRGNAQLRKNFDYSVYITLQGTLKIFAVRSFSSADLPLNAGEAKVIAPDVWLKDKDYRIAKEITFVLDRDYALPEKDKWNNFASFPLGLGEENPENDPNARPDLQVTFNKVQTPSDWICYSESGWNNPNIPGCALQISALVLNAGIKTVSGASGLDAELSILDSEGKEIYITSVTADHGVAPDSNILLNLTVSPLVHFMKGCALKLRVDSENRIAESREDNNEATISLPFCGHFPPLPDLRIMDLTIDRVGEGENASYLLQATCENAGNGIGNPTFDMHWYLDGEKSGTVGYLELTAHAPFPAPLSRFSVPFGVSVKNLASDKETVKVKIVIDNLGNFKEIDASNNIYEKELTLPQE